mmetsp:Transcript_32936/g.71832  ORF Transcript_32936/g.71832 Transcript_32936/m.71832 type:complete len:417 (-) Transcript_32936:112-1362(-)
MACALPNALSFAVLLVGAALHSGTAAKHSLRWNGRGPSVGLMPTSGTTGAAIQPASLVIIADQCQCHFLGVCSCSAAADFMDCIADGCASGACDCGAFHFEAACNNMSAACPNAGLRCSAHKATCLNKPSLNKEKPEEILADLTDLKRRKCRLVKALEDGFAIAEGRLDELRPEIQGRLDTLREKTPKAAAPYMGCAAGGLGVNQTTSWIGGEAVDKPVMVAARTQGKEAHAAAEPEPQPAGSFGARFWATLSSWLVYMLLLLLLAFLYNRSRLSMTFPQPNVKQDPENFKYGVCYWWKDWKLSALSCCCPALRWADTLDKANDEGGIISYWRSIAIILTLAALYLFVSCVLLWPSMSLPFHIIAIVFAVVMRQRLRRRYQITAGTPKTYTLDCLSWTFLPCCTMVQEARQVESER